MPQNHEIVALKVSEPLADDSALRPQTDGLKPPRDSGKPWQQRPTSLI